MITDLTTISNQDQQGKLESNINPGKGMSSSVIERIYSELKIGERAFVEKTLTETDVYIYAGITGDFSWLHVNENRSLEGHFKTRVVHGMLLVGLISNVVGNRLPGAGTIYENQQIVFKKPCFFNDTIKAEVQVLELLPRGRVKLRTSCYNQHGDLIIDGDAVVIPPRQHVIEKELVNSYAHEYVS